MDYEKINQIKTTNYKFNYFNSYNDLINIFNTFRFDVDLLTDSIAV